MEKFVITGGQRLTGEVSVSGAKNAVGAILPATILAQEICRIENIPNISDVPAMGKNLKTMGAGIKNIIIPKENERDEAEIPAAVREELNFIPASEADTVFRNAIAGL